jgi:hypothetical protein
MWSEQVSRELAVERVRDARGAGGVRRQATGVGVWARLARWARRGTADDPVAVLDGVTIRRSRGADRQALAVLAQLDSRALDGGDMLVAEVEGELRAALPLAGGAPIADPFRPTAALVSLLAMRAEQIRAADAAVPAQARPRATAPARAGR